MKRIHLFEIEDQNWFPVWLRSCMTRLMNVMHKLLRTEQELTKLTSQLLIETNSNKIVDYCSGSGGPMIGVVNQLTKKEEFKNLTLTLTDLYPDYSAAIDINASSEHIQYLETPIDATKQHKELTGLRTMVCSFHHMKPKDAKQILTASSQEKQPICIFEISDNSYPTLLWWAAIPFNIITCLLITPLARPLSIKQLLFTYIIPIIPICFAWDGAVSNARTYTLDDMDILLQGIQSDDYNWKKGVIKGKSKMLYLIGLPKSNR
ncbi:hypothetical protein V6R21_13635 [Limibacter armeniacum]|uniref:hypothetical protein n=1 Tax=Limibacter armeniacum TaxID=466084 RepID=UPI002FE511FB